MLKDNKAQSPSGTVPCALHDYLRKNDSANSFAKLSDRECRLAFQNWVAYGRTPISSVPTKEPMTCPLLWCRHRFDSFATCLQHVSACPWLSNAYYWCPQCQRAEKFIAGDATATLDRSVSPQRHSSKIKRAVSFFKHLGRKGCVHDPSTEAQERCTGLDAGNPNLTGNNVPMLKHPRLGEDVCGREKDFQPLPGQRRFESALQSQYLEQSSTLPQRYDESFIDSSVQKVGRDSTCFLSSNKDLVLMQRTRRQTLYDMEGNALSPLMSPNIESSEQRIAELATDDPLFNSSQLGDTSVTPLMKGFLTQGEHQMNLDPRLPTHYGPFSLSLCAPKTEDAWRAYWRAIAPEGRLQIVNDASAATQVDDEDAHMEDANAAAISFPLSQAEDCLTTPPLKCSAGTKVSKHAAEDLRAENLVQELHRLVRGLNYYWSEEVLENPESTVIQAPIHGMSAFEAGLRSLQQCFRGSFTTTVEGVLSLVQLALSCAYELHEQDPAFPWQDLLEDIINWHHTISAEDDRRLYVKTVKVLWAQMQGPSFQGLPLHSPDPDAMDQHTHTSSFEFKTQDTSLHAPEPKEVSMVDSDLALCPIREASTTEAAMLESRKRGLVIRTCSRYLNVLEHAKMVARADKDFSTFESPAGPSSANVERVETLIIQPLMDWCGITSFQQSLVYTLNMLYKGLLRNIHDVEIALTESAKACDIMAYDYEVYCTLVATLCDQSMQQHPRWRDRYYATYIDNALAVALEQENRKQISNRTSSKRPPPINVDLANSNYSQRSPGRLSAMDPKASASTTESIPSTGMSSVFESPASAAFSSASHRKSTSWLTPQSSPESSSFGVSRSPISPCTPFRTSITTNSLTLISPSTPSPTSTQATSTCLTCGASFTGSQQHRASNLKRHERTMHKRRSKLVCSEGGCEVEFSRSDNLRKHKKTAHGIEEPLKRKAHGKKRRSSDLKEITTWI